jgi:hypothetical protein
LLRENFDNVPVWFKGDLHVGNFKIAHTKTPRREDF